MILMWLNNQSKRSYQDSSIQKRLPEGWVKAWPSTLRSHSPANIKKKKKKKCSVNNKNL